MNARDLDPGTVAHADQVTAYLRDLEDEDPCRIGDRESVCPACMCVYLTAAGYSGICRDCTDLAALHGV